MGVRVPKVPSSEEEYESYLGGYIFEPYDGEESKKFKAFAKEKGWFIGSMGMTYMKPTGRPDEKETTDYDSESEEESEEAETNDKHTDDE